MSHTAHHMLFAILLIILVNLPGFAQGSEHEGPGEDPSKEAYQEEHAEQAKHDKNGEEHGGRPNHKNDFVIFLGASDDHVHPTEPTLGVAYRHRVARHLAVGALFDYAGGDQRNAIFGASVTWLPIGRLQLTAAPGVEFHRGSGATIDCGCGGALKSEDPEQAGLFDEDARYFVFRLGAAWNFPIGDIYGIAPNVNVDFVDGEKVWVYGVSFTFAW